MLLALRRRLSERRARRRLLARIAELRADPEYMERLDRLVEDNAETLALLPPD